MDLVYKYIVHLPFASTCDHSLKPGRTAPRAQEELFMFQAPRHGLGLLSPRHPPQGQHVNHEQIQQIACNIAAGNPSILATSGLRRNVYNGMKEVVKDNCCIIGGYLAACVKHRKRWMRANKRMLLVYTSETGICSERSRRHAKQIEMRRVLPRNYIIDCNTYIQHCITSGTITTSQAKLQ